MEGQIRRLAAAAESLELQARELRVEIRELADALSSQKSDPSKPAVAAEPVAKAPEPEAREPEPAEPPLGASNRAGGTEGARLVALSMALDGKPREEIARHLKDTFGLEDVDDVIDEVHAQADSSA
jgi:hypothetical protein